MTPMLRKVSMNIMVRMDPSTGVAASCKVSAISGPVEAMVMYENQHQKIAQYEFGKPVPDFHESDFRLPGLALHFVNPYKRQYESPNANEHINPDFSGQ